MITCKEYAKKRKEEIAKELKKYQKAPVLAIVQVGNDFASSKYTSFKIKDCEEVGIKPMYINLPEDTTTTYTLNTCIKNLANSGVDGIIVQLPLPEHVHFDENIIPAALDVDGFRKDSPYIPCTPKGILSILDANNIPIKSYHVVIIGRGKLVGEPLMKLMLACDATVSVCHSHTSIFDLKSLCQDADIIISAVGKPHIVTRDMVSYGAVVIDAGVSRDENGKVIGDCDYDDLVDKCSFITPCTGGVGVMTRLSLLENVVESFKKTNQKEE